MREKIRPINPLMRKVIQIAAFGFVNSRPGNFLAGSIYRGRWKKLCCPGLNCHSCPAAAFACPIGAMQAAGGSMDFSFGFYAAGLVLAFGIVMGRAVCGFLCPFGLIQELIAKIPAPRLKLHRAFTYVKYAVLLVFVFILPLLLVNYAGAGKPAFCEYICPAGLLEAGLPLMAAHSSLRALTGGVFILKFAILTGVMAACVFVYRFFCKVLCPLGAIYGLLNKISLMHIAVDEAKCVNCGSCGRICPMDTDPVRRPRSAECIMCGRCVRNCPRGALKLSLKP